MEQREIHANIWEELSVRVEINMRLPSLNEYINACRSNRFQGAKMKKDVEQDI